MVVLPKHNPLRIDTFLEVCHFKHWVVNLGLICKAWNLKQQIAGISKHHARTRRGPIWPCVASCMQFLQGRHVRRVAETG